MSFILGFLSAAFAIYLFLSGCFWDFGFFLDMGEWKVLDRIMLLTIWPLFSVLGGIISAAGAKL